MTFPDKLIIPLVNTKERITKAPVKMGHSGGKPPHTGIPPNKGINVAEWLEYAVANSLIDLSGSVTASNGLTETSGNVKLGGTLTENTSVASSTFDLLLGNTTLSANINSSTTDLLGNNSANLEGTNAGVKSGIVSVTNSGVVFIRSDNLTNSEQTTLEINDLRGFLQHIDNGTNYTQTLNLVGTTVTLQNQDTTGPTLTSSLISAQAGDFQLSSTNSAGGTASIGVYLDIGSTPQVQIVTEAVDAATAVVDDGFLRLVDPNGQVEFLQLTQGEYATEAAAASGGVIDNELYRNSTSGNIEVLPVLRTDANGVSYQAGNIGIGRDSLATAELIVKSPATGTATVIAVERSGGTDIIARLGEGASGNGQLAIQTSTGGLGALLFAGGHSFVSTAATTNFFGVGTGSPTYKLDVEGDGVTLAGLAKTTTGQTDFRIENTARAWSTGINASNNWVINDVTGATVPLLIQAGTPTNTMVLTTTGRLGLATASPAARLDVSSSSNTVCVRAASTSNSDTLYQAAGSTSGTMILFNSLVTATTLTEARFNNAGTGSAALVATTTGTTGDAYLKVGIASVQDWSLGVDNSDSDRLKIGPTANPSAGTASMVLDTSNNVVIGSAAAHGSGVLEVQSTTKGFLPPRMTAAQAAAISTPADGLMVYVTDTSATFHTIGHWGRVNSAWNYFPNVGSTKTTFTVGTEQTGTFTAVKGTLHPIDVSGGISTVNPPASPAAGDTFAVVDSRANSSANNITIDFVTATQNYYAASSNAILANDRIFMIFIYINSTIGWVAVEN